MNIKQKILKFLIENKEKTFNLSELSRALKIDYKLLYINVKKLEKNNSIQVEDLKSQKRCSFKDNFNEDVFIVENEKKTDLLKKKEFRAIYDRLREINKQVIILLFGSHAKGTATKHSDIDLLLICDEEHFKKVQDVINISPQEIHLTPVTYESFVRMATSKEFSVVSEVLKKNFILIGIEEYYRLLKNVSER